MSQTPYKRVDVEHLQRQAVAQAEAAATDRLADTTERRRPSIRWLILPASMLLCLSQALVTILASNVREMYLTATMIPILSFGVLFLLVLLINPLLRLLFIRPMNRTELTSLFATMMVTAGLSTFGLCAQLVPITPTPWNPEWNRPGSGWAEQVLPFLNRKLYLDIPTANDSDAGMVQALTETIQNESLQQRLVHDAVMSGATLPSMDDTQIRVVLHGAGLEADNLDDLDEDQRHRLEGSIATVQGRLAIKKFREGVEVPEPDTSAGWRQRIAYWTQVFAAIPWWIWFEPLAYWSIFILATYGMFYSLTHIVMGYWAQREKLIFPLAKLPESILPESDESRRWLPRLILGPGFWAGFAVSFLVWGWNAIVRASWVTNVGEIPLGMSGNGVTSLLAETVLEGLTGGHFQLKFLIIFTAIGIAFLLPVEISFSTWFYFIVGKLILLVMVWMGYGKSGADFPTDWIWINNPITALGAGGMLLFSAVNLLRCFRAYTEAAVLHAREDQISPMWVAGLVGLWMTGPFGHWMLLNHMSPNAALWFDGVMMVLTGAMWIRLASHHRIHIPLALLGTIVGGAVLSAWANVAAPADLIMPAISLFIVVLWTVMAARVHLLAVYGLILTAWIVACWLNWNNLPMGWAIAMVAFLTLLTLGLMRIVAEGGIYWFQSYVTPFHLYKMLGLGKLASLGPIVLVPLLPIYWVLYLDLKTFMAPSLMNATKMQKDTGRGRARFHLNLVLCILVTAAFAVGFAIFLAHMRGGQQMNAWFYNGGPRGTIDTALKAAIETPKFEPTTTVWYGLGGVWTALSMFLRRTMFWFPHPVGFIMLINPLMSSLWFSFFIGWIFKKLIVKYGGKTTFDRFSGVFIGLVIGELIAIFIWTAVALTFSLELKGIDLNRYS